MFCPNTNTLLKYAHIHKHKYTTHTYRNIYSLIHERACTPTILYITSSKWIIKCAVAIIAGGYIQTSFFSRNHVAVLPLLGHSDGCLNSFRLFKTIQWTHSHSVFVQLSENGYRLNSPRGSYYVHFQFWQTVPNWPPIFLTTSEGTLTHTLTNI